MTKTEFDDWAEFYMYAPFDDEHRYHRPAALISNSMAGRKIDDMMNWLVPGMGRDRLAAESGFSEADLRTFEAFGMKPPKRKK